MRWHDPATKGWVAPDWPEEYGGTGWTRAALHLRRGVRLRRRAAADAVRSAHVRAGADTFGTDAQKKRFLPRISGRGFWCQGYSEPGAGSDLASLKTRAVAQGELRRQRPEDLDHLAHYADWIFCLVRTDAKTQAQGISFLLIDMKTPGVTVGRSIRWTAGTR